MADQFSRDSGFPQNQAGLEVVPPETGLHTLSPTLPSSSSSALPTRNPLYVAGEERKGGPENASGEPAVETVKKDRRRILGLTIPIFWTLIVVLVVILAAAIGGGVGGGLSAQQKSSSKPASSSPSSGNNGSGGSSSSNTATPTASSATPSATPEIDPLTPTDGGCPGINNLSYIPYAADSLPVPFDSGGEPQQFREQCWTNHATSDSTHDILRTFTPTLEQCITVCAEYNQAYRAGLRANAGVGGGYCIAVTLVKEHAGFCYLKNGTGANDTMGSPQSYSSAILVTNTTIVNN
ncbi:hypothetical protein F5Y19DRAFT_472028 [Xylariaceae sp. FL1651]|nr:hypothetical protein F5Y19DRAFT_472028 [Xylariaceae sp. FL1651]